MIRDLIFVWHSCNEDNGFLAKGIRETDDELLDGRSSVVTQRSNRQAQR